MKIEGADRYQIGSLLELEKHVDQQISSNTFNLDANLTLLQFYQFQPSNANPTIIAKVLLKALTQLPHPSFKICVHLLPEKLQTDEKIAPIIALAQALETARFADFWTQAASLRDVLNSVPGFYDAIRNYMLHIISITFARVSVKVLSESIKVEGPSLDKLIADKKKTAGWTVQSSAAGDIIVLPKNDYNQVVVKRGVDTIKYDEVSSVLDTITVRVV